MSTIGQNIKEARIRKGLTQQDLATALNTTKAAISRYELNKREPRYRLLQEIALVLEISCSELIGDTELEMQMRRSALKGEIEAVLRESNSLEQSLEQEALTYYRQLNFSGKEVANQYLAQLVGTKKYEK